MGFFGDLWETLSNKAEADCRWERNSKGIVSQTLLEKFKHKIVAVDNYALFMCLAWDRDTLRIIIGESDLQSDINGVDREKEIAIVAAAKEILIGRGFGECIRKIESGYGGMNFNSFCSNEFNSLGKTYNYNEYIMAGGTDYNKWPLL